MADIKEVQEKDLKNVTGGAGEGLNRDLDITPASSDIGTTADENALPSEINHRQSL